MMKLWREEYTRPQERAAGSVTSILVHAALITLAVLATNPPEGFVQGLYTLANKVIYVAPPNRTPPSEESKGQVKYVDAAPVGDGSGFAKGSIGAEQVKQTATLSPQPGDLGTEQTNSVETPKYTSYDTVFTIAEVDSAVAVDPSSAAPAYPPALLKLGVEGSVMVRYVVDSLGRADISTLQIIRASRIEFAIAVREALPLMRFTPAKMGPKAVPQLVEQPFNFRIQKPDTTAIDPSKAKKPPV
jgi:outer membrane biosynthesis protein TonB